jgi:hypothetical protein
MAFSQDLHAMRAPALAYAGALDHPHRGTWPVLRRPALVALVLGAGSGFAATGHLTAGLLLSGFVCWIFVPLVQIATAALIMRRPAARPLPFGRRMELWFMGHAPWSLWILAVTFVMGIAPASVRLEWPIIATALVPIVWTSIIGVAFCRVVLGDSRGVAIARTALHQSVTWTIVLVYAAWAVSLWPRIVAFAGG